MAIHIHENRVYFLSLSLTQVFAGFSKLQFSCFPIFIINSEQEKQIQLKVFCHGFWFTWNILLYHTCYTLQYTNSPPPQIICLVFLSYLGFLPLF